LISSTSFFYTYGMPEKMWTKSRVSNLYRHGPNGVYYARVKVGGIDRWATLETDVFSVAEQRIKEKAAELKRGSAARKALNRGLATVGHAAELYQTRVELDTQAKPSGKTRSSGSGPSSLHSGK
jgi:hypothetical protein